MDITRILSRPLKTKMLIRLCNKDADQTVQMYRLICIVVVCI